MDLCPLLHALLGVRMRGVYRCLKIFRFILHYKSIEKFLPYGRIFSIILTSIYDGSSINITNFMINDEKIMAVILAVKFVF